MRRLLTEHAIDRYRKRINPAATLADIQATLDTGPVRYSAPWGVADRPPADTVGFIVTPEVVFPLVITDEPAYLAVTALRRRPRRVPKADRRMAREIARDESWA